MSKALVKKFAYHSTTIGGALASCAQLYNTLEVVLRCTFSMQAHEAKMLSVWLCLALGVSFEFPAAHRMYRKNSLFRQIQRDIPQTTVSVSHSRKFAQLAEVTLDGLTALTEGGLSFYSVFGLLNLSKEHPIPSILKYVLSALFGIPSTISVFSMNYRNSLSRPKNNNTTSTKQYHLGYQLLMLGLPSLITAIGHGLETLYDGQSSLVEVIFSEPVGSINCENSLFEFANLAQSLAFVAVGILAMSMAFKAGIREKMHIEKASQKHDGLLNWLKYTFRNILLGLGSVIAGFINTFPALAAIASFPISEFTKTFLLSCVFLLHGLGGAFVKGHYWQEAIRELFNIAKEWTHKIACCKPAEDRRPLIETEERRADTLSPA